MKTHHSRRAHGFTLVELLVVIAIIAVLAGAGFAAGNAAIQKAKKTTSLATVISIETAVNNFYSEYGAMPRDIDSDVTIDTERDIDFLEVLLGQESTGTTLNSRSIKFLSVREGKGDKNGIIYSKGGTPRPTGLFDPWGGPYNVILDGDYDEIVKPAPAAGGSATLNGRRCAAWSNGADGVSGTGGKTNDDVKNW